MSITARIVSNLNIAGFAMSSTIQRQAESGLPKAFTLPAGKAGVVNSDGGIDLAAGHGFEATQVVAVHWTDGVALKSCRMLTIDNAAAGEIDFTDAGEGEALPAADTDVVVSLQVVSEGVTFEGDKVKALAVKSTRNAVVDMRTSAASEIVLPLTADEAFWWADGHYGDNPVADAEIAQIVASNATTQAATLHFAALLDTVEN